MRLFGTPPKNGHSASGSQQQDCKDCGAHKVLGSGATRLLRGGKRKILRAYRERGSKRAISRTFGIGRCCIDSLARKKRREMGSVADGLRPAEENDVLELDEREDMCPEAFKQTMAQGLGSARRTRQVVANAHGDRSAKTCARLWSRIQQSDSSGTTDEAKASATSGNPIAQFLRATPVTGRLESPVASWPAHKRFFGRLRQKLARYVRRTRAASESERTGHLTTKLFVEWYNEAVT
ncbi:IS1 family transposase/ribosomal protein S14 [Salinibacter ruber]|nr:IS1 family transposase/ribosomal protein S14 [Salinibacter ruber]